MRGQRKNIFPEFRFPVLPLLQTKKSGKNDHTLSGRIFCVKSQNVLKNFFAFSKKLS